VTKHKCTWQLSEDGAAICLECATVIGADGLIESLQEEIAALRAIARSAAQEEETKLDENQFITQQSRIVKLAALREAGYLKEEG